MEDGLKVYSLNADPAFRIVVMDRDPMSSILLADTLRRDRRYETSTLFPSDILPALDARRTNLLVLSADLHAGPGRGFELAHAAHRRHPELLILMLLDHPNRESVIRAFRSGARGIVSRRQTPSEFLECIEHLIQGKIWAGKVETNYLLEALEMIPAPTMEGFGNSMPLTGRELQVVQYAAQGKTNKAIASELGLSEHTIKNYLFHAFEKLGVSSRVELLFYLTTSRQASNGWLCEREACSDGSQREQTD
jgi:two-component system, NarL family, nitrate/nitrite response regulator NarL